MKYALYGLVATALVAMSSGCATTCCGPVGGGGALDTMFGGCTSSSSCGGCTRVGGGCSSGCASGGCASSGPAYATVSDSGYSTDGYSSGGYSSGGPAIAAPVISSGRNLSGGCGAGCGIGLQPVQAAAGSVRHVARTVATLPQALQNGCANGTHGEFVGPTSGMVQYPYYTTRGPRDFFMANPPSIGP